MILNYESYLFYLLPILAFAVTNSISFLRTKFTSHSLSLWTTHIWNICHGQTYSPTLCQHNCQSSRSVIATQPGCSKWFKSGWKITLTFAAQNSTDHRYSINNKKKTTKHIICTLIGTRCLNTSEDNEQVVWCVHVFRTSEDDTFFKLMLVIPICAIVEFMAQP